MRLASRREQSTKALKNDYKMLMSGSGKKDDQVGFAADFMKGTKKMKSAFPSMHMSNRNVSTSVNVMLDAQRSKKPFLPKRLVSQKKLGLTVPKLDMRRRQTVYEKTTRASTFEGLFTDFRPREGKQDRELEADLLNEEATNNNINMTVPRIMQADCTPSAESPFPIFKTQNSDNGDG